MTTISRGTRLGLCAMAWVMAGTAMAQMPKTSKESIPGTATVKTEQLQGMVVAVDGSHLAVKMSGGELKTFNVPASRRFLVDGRELTVGQLKPGTKLTATVTTTTTPITDRTTTIGAGQVFFVSGHNVILTLPNNENRQYKVADNYRFMVDGQKASVFELRKGMTIRAEKIVEEPRTEFATNIMVTGEAPAAPVPQKAPVTQKMSEPPVRAAEPPKAAPPVAAAPAPRPAAQPAEPKEETPAELPKTASPMPSIGLAGVIAFAASFVLRRLRQA